MLASAAWPLAALWPNRWRCGALVRRAESRLMALTKRLNRTHRSAATRVYRGLILLLLGASMAALIGLLLSMISARLQLVSPWFALLEIALIALLLPLRALRDQVSAAGKAVHRGHIAQAKGLAGALVRRDVGALEAHGLLRASLEALAEGLCTKLLAPLLGYVLLGLPALLALRFVHWLSLHIGHSSHAYLAFGWAAAKCDAMLMWIPARMTALLIALASVFVPKGKPLASLMMCVRQARQMRSPNAGWPLAAMAGALGIALGGARTQEGARIDNGWMGTGSARIAYSDFRRGLTLACVACLLLWLICLLALAAML